MQKIIKIDGKDVGFKATALTPRLYRHLIGRDLIADMMKLQKSAIKTATKGEELSPVDLEIFENAAYVMARQYDNTIADNADEWLDSFSTFSIYDILPQIMELWQINEETTSRPKKK